MTGFDELPEHLGRVPAFALALAILHRPIEDVEAAEVEQVKWTHRPVKAFLNRDVDVLGARVAAFQQAHRLLGGREQDAVDDEAPDLLLKKHGSAIDAAHELHGGLNGCVRGFWTSDDLAQLHHGDRVKEMRVAAL